MWINHIIHFSLLIVPGNKGSDIYNQPGLTPEAEGLTGACDVHHKRALKGSSVDLKTDPSVLRRDSGAHRCCALRTAQTHGFLSWLISTHLRMKVAAKFLQDLDKVIMSLMERMKRGAD